jgi:hypothetical protein
MKYGFVISTFVALVLITVVTVYATPLGLRGVFTEGFQTNSPVMNLKLARANMAREGFQGTQVTPVIIPPAQPQGITTTTMKVGQNKPPMASTPTMNTPTVSMPVPMPTPSVTPPPNAAMMGVPPPPNGNMMDTQRAGMPGMPGMDASGAMIQGFQNMGMAENQGNMYRKDMKEGFRSNYAEVSGGAKDNYQAMGPYDGVRLPTGNDISTFRTTSPNEPLLGAPFKVGDDDLFIFKNNQCKPECCGASFSCSGGCVCTTPDQRDYINGRGGNRTAPADD